MLSALAKLVMRIGGWTPEGEIPPLKKAVFIAAPHTSNWDGFWLIVYRISFNIKLSILAKHTLFWWPLGNVLRACGAVPLDRSQPSSTVQQLVDMFEKQEHFFLALAPEGTRRKMPYWKTGFYQIAVAAKVPIVLAFIDYEQRKMGIGIQLDPADDIDVNLEKIREFYAPFKPCRPDRLGPIAFPPTTPNSD
ncbi:MAG: acyltransferase [Gammaproteobacteria bacterium]|nr:acyltransferase [Gammaproteobacteria bacterium]